MNMKNVYLNIIGISEHGKSTSDFIRFGGKVSETEKIKYYQASDAFILPSRGEGFALAPLEAMGCGLPCILSNQTGINEIVTNNLNGVVINGFNPKKYSTALERLAYRIKFSKSISKASRVTALRYNCVRMTRRYYEFYKKISICR